jgi:hypothetical protein
MLGTYVGALALLVAAAAVGQAIFALCGRNRWSWLAPAVGLAALMPIAWWSVRLPGEGTAAIVVVAVVAVGAIAFLAGRATGLADAARLGVPVAAAALLLASIPFIVEGRFGILGTGLNPDMSQHLFAADRLADSGSERLISSGYPLGPHSLAVALNGLGISLVHGFGAVTVTTALVASLAPLGLLSRLPAARRITAALLVGFAYMTAAYLTQGAFKETLQAAFLLAFAIGLERLARGRLVRRRTARAVPLAVLAAGSIYVYSFPGLLWLGGAAGAWAVAELAIAMREGGRARVEDVVRGAVRPTAIALGVLILAIVPEVGRMIDFASFETFDPGGAGLGNLFNPLSPLEALGIWPSGDFRLDPGDGAAPAIVYHLGGAIGLAALAFGLWWWLRRSERAVPAALAVAALLIAYAHIGGTPYQEAKAIALAAPLAMLISIRALAEVAPTARQAEGILRRRRIARLFPHSARLARARLGLAALAAAFTVGAGGCSLIALANGPVGPTSYSPALAELRPLAGPTLVLLPADVRADEHGRDYYVWELRGGRVCVADEADAGGEPPPGIRNVVVLGQEPGPPFAGAASPSTAGPYTVWSIARPTPGASGCPFVSDGQRADPGGG